MTFKYSKFVILSILFSSSMLITQVQANEPDCPSLEKDKYNALVCHAEQLFTVGLYNQSVNKYLQASKVRFVDVPNYALNSKIAHAYLLSGNVEKAQAYIKRSEIILATLTGIYSCVETDDDRIYIIEDGTGKALASEIAHEVTFIMCGGAFDYFYNPKNQTFKSLIKNGELVKHHVMVDALIQQRLAMDNAGN